MPEELGLTGSPGRFTYNGNEFDDEYGFNLYYYGARYMDPALGRFTTTDPVMDFINPYSYVGNNPMNRIDPTGTAWRPTHFSYGLAQHLFNVAGPEDDVDMFFDTKSQMELAREYVEYAMWSAKALVSSDKDNSGYWEEVATALFQILRDDLIEVSDKLASNNYANWDSDRNTLQINSTYLNRENGEYLVAAIIHEGAHKAFDTKHENNYTKWQKKGESARAAYKRYEARSEQYALRGNILFLANSTHIPLSPPGYYPDNPLVRSENYMIELYQEGGLGSAIYNYMQDYYPELWDYVYGPWR